MVITRFTHGNIRPNLSRYFRLCSIVQFIRGITLKPCFFFGAKPVKSQRRLSMTNSAQLKPEVVLSEKSRKECIERLHVTKSPWLMTKSLNEAAVLVPLCVYKGELGFLYTLRSMKLNVNRGQISFPGGKRDRNDKDMCETALRETWEELSIPREQVDVWGCANPLGREKVNITPVLGYIGEVKPQSLRINRDEVEEAFVVSLQNLCDPSRFGFTQFRNSYTLPVFVAGKHRIWGLTAITTHLVLKALVPNAYKSKLVYLSTIGHTVKKSKSTTVTPRS